MTDSALLEQTVVAFGRLLELYDEAFVIRAYEVVLHRAPDAEGLAHYLARVRAGAEVVIESGKLPVAVVRAAEPHVRLLSESLRLAKEHASTATLDAEFAKDVEAAIESHREPLNPPAWD